MVCKNVLPPIQKIEVLILTNDFLKINQPTITPAVYVNMSSSIQSDSAEPIRERTLVLTQDTTVDKLSIEHAILIFGNPAKVNLRPIYQRNLRWKIKQYVDFVNTIMIHGYIPNIVLYKLHDEDDREYLTNKFECIDGQHRLCTIFKFKNSEPILIGKREHMITWHHQHTDTYLFYIRNAHTEKWRTKHPTKKVSYLTEKEKSDFDECRITVEQIMCRMTYDERCRMFTTLQQGTPVLNSDLYKNFVDIPIILCISHTMRMEGIYRSHIHTRLTNSAEQNWLFCAVRLCMIAISSSLEDRLVWVNSSDIDIRSSLSRKAHNILNITAEQLLYFEQEFNRWISLLKGLPHGMQFTPIQMLAMYVRLQEIDFSNEHMLEERLTDGWAGKGTKEAKTLWYRDDETEKIGGISRREQYFNECMDYLRADSSPLHLIPIFPRKPLSKKNRCDLWDRDADETGQGRCYVCSTALKKDEEWHAGHIKAHAKGGSDTDLDNFIVECSDCNLKHGTENALVYKNRNFTEPKRRCLRIV